jgi:hypothetical protein
MVGRPDLSKLPLMAAKDYLEWSGDPNLVARKVRDVVQSGYATTPPAQRQAQSRRPGWMGGGTSLPATEPEEKRANWMTPPSGRQATLSKGRGCIRLAVVALVLLVLVCAGLLYPLLGNAPTNRLN